METKLLTEKYSDELHGVLNCYDRVIISGNLQPFCYAQGMTNYLYQHQIRIFDYARFAEPLTGEIRANAEGLAQENGLTIEFIRKKNFRQEKRVHDILKKRGNQPGLVHIFSALETCPSYQPWHDKKTGKNFLKSGTGKCLHYYFYFIDPDLGLCFVRVSTWCPFTIEFYFNGHAWLASQLKERGITFELRDNAFTNIADFALANQLSEHLNVEQLHAKLDELAQRYCPVVQTLQHRYQWSLRQAEYATDLVFKQSKSLAFYLPLLHLLVLCVKPDNIATFLGQKLHGNYQGEIGTRLNVRQWGTRIKHFMGPVSIKMYDKFGLILRIETTVNDVSFFQQYREVHHRTGKREMCWAKMKKTIYSLAPLQEVLVAANRRYLAFISEIETPEVGVSLLNQLTHRRVENQHSYKGFNFLAEEDAALLRALLRGEFVISGLTHKALHQLFPDKTGGQISRSLKRLRVHGLLKKVGKHYKYYLTHLGRQVAAMALKLREMSVIPTLAGSSAA
jgi:hypothetical protein